VLVPGCGLGHDVRLLADLGIPACGLDISQTAVASASALTQHPHAHFEHGDFLDPAWSQGRKFKAIWEHTCFCAIDPTLRGAYARAIAAVLDPGGIFAGVFYLTPSDPGDDDAGPPFEATIEELDALFSPWFERIDGWVPERCYPGREGREWIGIFRKLPHLRVVG
jgi:SAM-dependent methyltransferase